jgi:Na+/glutamate symporter
VRIRRIELDHVVIAVGVTNFVTVALYAGMALVRAELPGCHPEAAAFAEIEPSARGMRRALAVIMNVTGFVVVLVAGTGALKVYVRGPEPLTERGVQSLHRQQQQHDPGNEMSVTGSQGASDSGCPARYERTGDLDAALPGRKGTGTSHR